jgi:tetratricopeptide (TPR) repeat protein
MRATGNFAWQSFLLLLGLSIAVDCLAQGYDCSDMDPVAGMPNMAEFSGAGDEASSRARDEFAEKIDNGSVKPGRGYYCLGQAFYDAGDSEKALAFFTKSIEVDSDRILPYFGRARAAIELEQCARAIDDYTHVLNQGIRRNEILLMRAKAYAGCDEPERTKGDLKLYEQRVGQGQRSDRYYEVRSALGASSGGSGLDQDIAYWEGEVEKFSALSRCSGDSDYCSMPRLVSAVDALTDVLCRADEGERAEEVFSASRHYQRPSPKRPFCLDGGQ